MSYLEAMQSQIDENTTENFIEKVMNQDSETIEEILRDLIRCCDISDIEELTSDYGLEEEEEEEPYFSREI